MEYLSTGKFLLVDLSNLEIEEEDLDEDLFKEHFGGVGLNIHLYNQYLSDDPIVIGTGLLTGTLFPGSSLGIISGKSPKTGNLSHAPITLKTALELKYAGFDYVVIKGKSQKPVYLWIHDGVADLNEAQDVWGKDVWTTTDTWRESIGDEVLQTIVIGPAGESKAALSQICLNYWSTGDRFGFGALFGEKNLKGIAIRGMGLLEIASPEEFVKECFEILKNIKERLPSYEEMGVEYLCARLGYEDVVDWLKPIVHRHIACYNTPFATNTFVFLDEDPSLVTESSKEEPGFLISDVNAILDMKQAGFSAKDCCEVLRECSKLGIDPSGVAKFVKQENLLSKDEVLSKLSSIATQNIENTDSPFSSWAPKGLEVSGDWLDLQVISYIFGIHPTFMLMFGDVITKDVLLNIVNLGTELELEEENLNKLIETIKG